MDTQTFARALVHHKAGQFGEAERLYRLILAQNPRQAEALHMLGVLAHQAGQNGSAEELIRQAIGVQPGVAGYHGNLGMVLAAQGKLNEAIASYQRAVELQPRYAEGFKNLASLLLDAGKVDESIDASRRALGLNPNFAEAHYNLGTGLRNQGDLSGAAAAFGAAAATATPGYAEPFNALGDVLAKLGLTEQAIEAFQKAIAIRPAYPEAYNNLGNALRDIHRLHDAAAAYRAALSYRPDDAVVLNNLGTLLEGVPESAEQSLEVYRRALAVQPDLATAHYNLANALRKLGRIGEAIDHYRKAWAEQPDQKTVSNLLYTIHFHPDFGPAEIAAEHARWNEEFVRPLAKFRAPHRNDRAPERKLRIGYVSPDFRDHPVGRFLMPLFRHHDHQQFQVYCYSDVRRETAMTSALRQHAEVWRETSKLSDAELADLVQADGIDILVDLAMHMENNRMPAFARKPAPVQVTYLAYCSTTGSEAMDYRLTDSHLDPLEAGDGPYVEKAVRLRSYWCYSPPDHDPEPAPPPCLKNGLVTFGCLNNFSKVSDGAMKAWCGILRALPDSRLILHTLAGSHHKSVLAQFAAEGVEETRIRAVGFVPTRDYLKTYNEIDIALDPFPYPGGTTTFDALWMGVPVVSMAGRTSVSRGGRSILANLGLSGWVAEDGEQYVAIACSMAGSVSIGREARTGLHERLGASVLMDAEGFARDIESAYRGMWRKWCAAG